MDIINRVDDLGRTLLHKAVVMGDIELLDVLLDLDIDLNIKDEDGYTAVHLAAKKGNIAILDKLIQKGANINLKDRFNWTALTYACDGCHEELVRLLLANGVVIDAISLEIAVASASSSEGVGEIILDSLKNECNTRILEAFCSQDLDKLREIIVPLKPLYRLQDNEILSIDENTKATWILEEAHRLNNEEVLQILLENDIELDLQNYNSNMLLMACDYGSLSNVEVLLDKNISMDVINERGESCVFIAARNNDIAKVKLMLSRDVRSIINTPNEFGIMPLHIACAYGNDEMVSALIDSGANIYCKVNLNTFLDYLDSGMNEHISAKESNIDMVRKIGYFFVDSMGLASCIGSTGIISILTYDGYYINRPIHLGNTAFHIASMVNNIDMMKYLVMMGADINARNEDGNTALHIACFRKKSRIVLELVAMGANALIYNKYWKTPLHVACEEGNECIIRLLSNDYNVMHSIKKSDINKVTLLHLACKRLDVDGVKRLLDLGAKVNVVDVLKNSPLHYMFQSDIKKDREERVKSILGILKGKGLNINAKNVYRYNALDVACMNGKVKDACILIENGAKVRNKTISLIKKVKKGNIILDFIEKKKMSESIHIERIGVPKDVSGIEK